MLLASRRHRFKSMAPAGDSLTLLGDCRGLRSGQTTAEMSSRMRALSLSVDLHCRQQPLPRFQVRPLEIWFGDLVLLETHSRRQGRFSGLIWLNLFQTPAPSCEEARGAY